MKIFKNEVQELLKTLKDKYPNELPKQAVSNELLHIKIGNQQVIQSIEDFIEYNEGKSK